MGWLDFFKKTPAPEEAPEVSVPPQAAEPVPSPAGPIRPELRDTPEKFAPMAEELVPFLAEHLRGLCALETEIFARSRELEAEKLKHGIPAYQTAPGSQELWEEYRERYGRLAAAFCTPKLLERGYAGSCGKPAKYEHLNTGCDVFFTMKSAKRAVVETSFHRGLLFRHQFVLKHTEAGWQADQVSYAHGQEDSWHIDHI